jgi:hypothetical protein
VSHVSSRVIETVPPLQGDGDTQRLIQCATNAEGGCCRRSLRCGAVQMMKGLWPFGVALRGEMSNHLKPH